MIPAQLYDTGSAEQYELTITLARSFYISDFLIVDFILFSLQVASLSARTTQQFIRRDERVEPRRTDCGSPNSLFGCSMLMIDMVHRS